MATFLCSAGQAQTKVIGPLSARIGSAGPDERMAVMVYFVDKGHDEKEALDKALEERVRQLTPRALKRRAKMGKAEVSYQDLAVSSDYLKEISNLGARHRQTLNWFNAASFEMTKDQIAACAGFRFVDRIELLRSRRRSDLPPPEPSMSVGPPLEKSRLNYGPSYRQNLMINAVACHDSGYSGAGVLVAMFDNGFRKNHQAFDAIISSGRLVDEWDFVANHDTVEWSGHGTGTWSLAGGFVPGQLVGPAYGASWAVYHTEDNNQEMPVEEDHWAAALQRADSIGADIVSSSLGYRYFDSSQYNYSYQQLNGQTAISTLAARHAASLGILVCNAMANDGPEIGTLAAPADADSIVSVGATDSLGFIADYSSRGPTYDGRPKPEVCAQGSSTWWAQWSSTTSYGWATGTSCATPLVSGACALVLEAHPDWTPMQVREALMMTASRAANPDSNSYGWGVIDVWAAIHYDPFGVIGWPVRQPSQGALPLCWPNPFRDVTTLCFNLSSSGPVTVSVYEASGRLVWRRRLGRLDRGAHELQWTGIDHSGRRMPSGVYIVKTEGPGQFGTTRVLLVR
jgi:subtilisin family serine protease